MQDTIVSLFLAGNLLLTPIPDFPKIVSPVADVVKNVEPEKAVLAKETLDFTKRNQDEGVNEIFRDNILLNLHYMKGDAESIKKYHGNKDFEIDWEKVREPFGFELILEPRELFAFHDEMLPEFRGMKAKTGFSKFTVAEGYKVADGLSGDGVCHLATLINWVASEAGLSVTAKVNHDFYPVPGVDRKYGTSIVYIPGAYTTQMQNLYVVNNSPFPVTYQFKINNNIVELTILK